MRHRGTSVILAYTAFVLVGISAGINGVLLVAQMDDYGVSRATIGLTGSPPADSCSARS